MQLQTRTWYALSLFFLLGAIFFWWLGRQWAERNPSKPGVEAVPALDGGPGVVPGAPAPAATGTNAQANPATPAAVVVFNPAFPHRLANTALPLDELIHLDQALLLRNAFFDTTARMDAVIPAHLRAAVDTASWIVQARGPMDAAFRARLAAAGASVVAYVPNNAYLVRVSAEGAATLRGHGGTQAVLPWEPYYKLDPQLLPLAIGQEALPEGVMLNLLFFPGTREPALTALSALGAEVVGEDRSPFGWQATVNVPPGALVVLAQRDEVQAIEPHTERRIVNDLARVRQGVAPTSAAPTNYLGLTGMNVLVGVNDTGVDGRHPDLMGRVFGDTVFSTTDFDGHGTHVAGTIASSGENSPMNVPGAASNANFRGVAPMAKIFAQPVSLVFGPVVSDGYLQENSARTNAYISNNSWSYGGSSYSFASANWDAAVRDALPGVSNSQPLIVVFAAGNSGGGGNNGLGGFQSTIDSPGNAKNVITVGAIENLRSLTNLVSTNMSSGRPWAAQTDSSNQVASFSGRGNVSPGTEGEFGRFKPDVVAPGVFTVSTRSEFWRDPTGGATILRGARPNQFARRNTTNQHAINIPPNGTQLLIRLFPQAPDTDPLPDLPIWVKAAPPPPGPADLQGTNQANVAVTPGNWFFSIINTNDQDLIYEIRTVIVVTNNPGAYFIELKALNDQLAPHYRFETGTSQSAPAVSGTLALMQEFFEQRFSRTNSPALMKALLINGARSASTQNPVYGYNVRGPVNQQGWGLVNLSNSVPPSLMPDAMTGPLVMFDEDPTNALATGQSITRVILVNSNAQNFPMRITLVWTDPPGNPAVGTKLVNDLDLIVTNLTTREVYSGNNFLGTSLFTSVTASNTPPPLDRVNNVENVYVNRILAGSYSVTVRANRVNVNAVTVQTNEIAQDFALVISSGNPLLPAAITVSPPVEQFETAPQVVTLTNGVPSLNHRSGAHLPFLASTNGLTNQWIFFVVTNVPPTGGMAFNIAFATFLPPNLGIPRTSAEADVDLYVSDNPAITNLDETVLNAPTTYRSTKRGGNESIILTNATPGALYYAGVKAEDQQSSVFGFFAISSVNPFSSEDEDGTITAEGYPIGGVDIPDGSPTDQPPGLMLAFVTQEGVVENVTVDTSVTHENGGDLVGKISHDTVGVTLFNGRVFAGQQGWTFDESDSGEIPNPTLPDGPGSLRDFVGEEASGAWILSAFDLAPGFTGRVDSVSLTIQPRKEGLTNETGITVSIQPGAWFYTVVDVPGDATNLLVCVAPEGPPLEVYIRRGAFPDRTNYHAFAVIAPPGQCLSISRDDSPPLSQGRYFIGIFNPTTDTVTANVRVAVQRALASRSIFSYRSTNEVNLIDNAVTRAVLDVDRRGTLADVSVGVRIDHDRVADLVLHLVSPQGTRVLLTENRGGPLGSGYGSGRLQTNVFPSSSTGGAMASSNVFGPVLPVGLIEVEYDFYGIPDQMRIYYEDELIFDSDLISFNGRFSVEYGPGTATNLTIVMNEGDNPNAGTAWEYTATVFSGIVYANFTENTSLLPRVIKFEPPPFTSTNAFTNTVIPVTGFDKPLPAGPYTAPVMFDGWTVVTNAVEVIDDPGLPLGGDQALALGEGVITRLLPTIMGRSYRLQFSHRDRCIVSWWQGEDSPNDVYNRNNGFRPRLAPYRNAKVGRGFRFNTAADAVSAIASPSLNVGTTNGFTVELWVNPDVVNADQPLLQWDDGSGTLGVYLAMNSSGQFYTDFGFGGMAVTTVISPPSLAPGVFQHLALVYDGTTSNALLYVNGARTVRASAGGLPVTTNGLTIGASTALGSFRGTLDEITIYSCALTGPEIAAVHRADVFGKCAALGCEPGFRATVADNSMDFISQPVWQRGLMRFVDLTNGTLLHLQGTPFSSLLDSLELIELPQGANYFPEETLAAFRGEQGFGDWTLEITDTRSGGALSNATLVSWRLNLTFVNTNPPATTLTNMLAWTNCVVGDDLHYFVVNVPAAASHATNFLFSQSGLDLDLLFNQGALPTGRRRTDFVLLDNLTNGIADVWINGTRELDPATGALIRNRAQPRLIPGRRYYLAVRNVNAAPDETNKFVIRVDFNHSDSNLLDVVTLSNAMCYPAMPTNLPANSIRYFQFDAASNAVWLSFSATPALGDIGLVARRFLPLPDPDFYSYISDRPGGTIERIDVSDFTYTQLAGRWYLGVYNTNATPAAFTICATQAMANVRQLTDKVVTNTVLAGGVDYYKVRILPNAFQADFIITNRGPGDVDLYVRQGLPFPPSPVNFDYASTNAGVVNELAVVTNSAPFPFKPLTPGDWCIAVTNGSGLPATYEIVVIQYTNAPYDPFCLTNRLAYTTNLSVMPGVDYYKFPMSFCALQAEFELFGLSGAADVFIVPAPLPPLPPPSSTNFTYAGTNGMTNSEFIRVFDENCLPDGEWYLAVANRDTFSVNYTIRATELVLGRDIFDRANGVTYMQAIEATNGVPHIGVEYYRFNVSTNALQVDFEAFGLLTNNVDIFVGKGLPLPVETNHVYAGTNSGTASERVTVLTNSSPLPLMPGDWFMAVLNRDPSVASYKVRITEITTNQVAQLSNGIAQCTTLSPAGGALYGDTRFYAFTVSSNAFQVTFETFGADGDVDLYATRGLPITQPTNFAYASTTLGSGNENIIVLTNSTPVALAPGEWYLAVVNRTGRTVNYCVRATEIQTDGVRQLLDGVTQTNMVMPVGTVAGMNIDYYVFTVSNGVAMVNFETFNATGNVDLYVRFGLPIPAINGFPYASIRAGMSNEFVLVLTNSAPVALTNGDWYVAVVNRETNKVTYSVRATQIYDGEITRLTDGIGRMATAATPTGSGHAGIDYYVFTVETNALQANFEAYDLGADVDLYLRKGLPVPGETLFDYAGTRGGTTNEFVPVAINSTPVALMPGDWYLAVVNRSAGLAPYTVRATQIFATNVVRLTNGIAYHATNAAMSTLAQVGVQHYVFRVDPGAFQTTFEVFEATAGNVDLFVSRGLPVPGVSIADYASTNGAPTNETIIVLTNSTPVALAPGDWYLTVVNRDAIDVPYSVRATQVRAVDVVRLISGRTVRTAVTASNELTALNQRYFVFDVPTNAVQVNFELFALTGNADLFLRRGLPLPGETMFEAAGTNGGLISELVILYTNGLPVALTPGDWHLTVINRTTNTTFFSVRATEILAGQIVTLTNAVTFTGAVERAGSAAGATDYYCFEVTPAAVLAAFETYGADGNVDLYVRQGVPFPGPGVFDYSSLEPGSLEEVLLVTTNSPVALAPGRWYLAVVNRSGFTVNYSVRATEFASTDITTLTSGTPLATSIPADGLETNAIRFYRVTIATNTIIALFDTFASDGDVDLWIGPGWPPPYPPLGAYASISIPSGDEFIALATNSFPVPLTAGDWYLAVRNYDTNVVNYSVLVREFGPFDFVELTNSVPYTNTLTAPGDIDFLYFIVSSNAAAVDFSTFGASGDVDLYVSRSFPATLGDSDYVAETPGSGNETIQINGFCSPVLLEPGLWFVFVGNRELGAVSYSITATEMPLPPPLELTNRLAYTRTALPPCGGLIPGVDYYRFNVATDAVSVVFEAYGASGDVDLFLSSGQPLPRPGTASYSSTNAGLLDESVIVITNSAPVELAAGDWYLGVVNREAVPVNYTVRVTQVTAAEIIRLTNGLVHSDFVPAVGDVDPPVRYFVFTVSDDAVRAAWETFGTSGDLDLYLTRGVPLPTETRFDYTSAAATSGDEFIAVNSSSLPAPLTPGDWFLMVVNREVVPVGFNLHAYESFVTPLTNNVAFTNSLIGGNRVGVDYYSFTVSTGAVQAVWETLGASSDLDVFLRRGSVLPGPTLFDFTGTNGGATNEVITVLTNSIPVPLSAGVWTLAVVNRDPTAGSYAVRVRQVAATTLIQLPACASLPGGLGPLEATNFTFRVGSNAVQTLVHLASTNVQMYASRALPLPGPGAFDEAGTDYSDIGSGQFIAINTNSLVPLTPGAWYLTLVNTGAVAQPFEISACDALSSEIISLASCVTYTNAVSSPTFSGSGGRAYFRFNVSADADQVRFELFGLDDDADLLVSRALPLPFQTSVFGPMSFDYASTNAGTTAEQVLITTNSAPVPLGAGEWFVAVMSRGGAARFSLRVVEFTNVAGPVITLTNGVAYRRLPVMGDCAAGAEIDYYRFDVTTNAQRAHFKVLGANEDVTLVLRKGLPLPDAASFDYQSANAGTNDELITLFGSSTPVGLSAGEWYLGVIHSTNSTVSYRVRATEFPITGTNLLITRWQVATGVLCLTWTNTIPGLDYFVQGKTSLSSPVWMPASATVTATNYEAAGCVPLPTTFTIFRVTEGSAPVLTPASVGFSSLNMTPAGFTLVWSAPTNQSFAVEWTPSLPATSWNAFTNLITSASGVFSFTDDGSQSGGLSAQRFYRIIVIP